MNSLCRGATTAIDAISKAGATVDAALAAARRQDAGYSRMQALLYALSEAGTALKVLGQATRVETDTGAHMAQIIITNDRFQRESEQAKQACAAEIAQIKIWQAEELRLLSGTAMQLLRSAMEFAWKRERKLNLLGLVIAYAVGAIFLLMIGFSGQQNLIMALAFPMSGIALALFAERQLTNAADAIVAQAAQKVSDAENRLNDTIARLTRDRDATLRQINDALNDRLQLIDRITAQADSMLEQRAMEAGQVIASWVQNMRSGFLQVEKAAGNPAPPTALELGTLKCRIN